MKDLCTNCHTGNIYAPSRGLRTIPPLCLNCFLKAWGYVKYQQEIVAGLTNEGLEVNEAADLITKELLSEMDKLPASSANSIAHLIETIATWLAEQEARPTNISELKTARGVHRQ